MKRTIRRQMMVVFVGLIIFILLLMCIVNSGFLEKYYIAHKQVDLTATYETMDKALEEGNLTEDSISEKMSRQLERTNISVVVVKNDGTVIFTTGKGNGNSLYLKLLSYIFEKNQDSGKLLKTTEHYQIYQTRDFMTGVEYLEMWGDFSDGSNFVMRSPIESIRESAGLANQFLVYMGLIGMAVGGLLVWFFSQRLTKPLQELAELSKRMANLDFDAKYTSGGVNEIGVLGENFNIMSNRLEKTISELKSANLRLQEDIEQKEKLEDMRTEFLGNVSHELKTPLALIQGYAEGLKEGVNDDPESREFYCDVIIDEAGKMNQMVKNLLTLNQLEFGAEQLDFERFDIVSLIRGVLASCEILIQQAGAEVDFVADSEVYVWADEFKTEQVFRNYLTNAIHHAENEKKIEIRVIRCEKSVRITVFNSGRPIPEEDIDKLWDKFYKVDKAHTREYGGNGIGLSIVKAIMDSFHQDYGVKNFSNGVEFWFELDYNGMEIDEKIEGEEGK